VDQLINDKSAFQEIDMGHYDEEDKQYIFVDIKTKQIYDLRKENDLMKLQEEDSQYRVISLDKQHSKGTTLEGIQATNAAVKEWWIKKRKNNQDLLLAAENGNLAEMSKLLDRDTL
jgi:hypothetical protein